MNAYLDDRPINADRPTLASVLAHAAVMAESAGRIVVEVKVDGEHLTGDMLESPSDEELGDVEIRMITEDPATVATQALGDAAAQLERTRDRQSECAALVQVGKITEAMQVLSECLGDWQAAQSVVVSVAQLTDASVATNEDAIDDLAARLDQLKSALHAQDWATVADLLAYDLDEQVTSWSAMLEDMRHHLQAPTEGS